MLLPWTLVLALLRPRSFLARSGMMGMGTTCGEAAPSWSSWHVWYWRVRILSGPQSYPDDHAALGRLGRAIVLRQLTDALGRISCPWRSRCSHLESGALFPCPSIWHSLFWASGCCFLSTRIGFFGRLLFSWVQYLVRQWIHTLRQYFGGYGRISHIFCVAADLDPEAFLHHSSLDVPVPQMANQLVEVCRQIDTPIPEQAIEVPKISSSRQSHRRRVRFAERTAEQLVEEPTIISYSSLRGIVEQNVDIPAPLDRGRSRGGLGFHPGQSSTAFSGADHRSGTAEQIVDIPAPRGVQDLPSSASSSGLPGTANHGVFRTFPRGEKVRTWARTRGQNCSPSRAHPRRRLSWRISSRMQLGCGCLFPVAGGNFWARTKKCGGQGEGWDVALVMRQPTTSSGRISSCFLSFMLAQFALGIWYIISSCPSFWQSLFRVSFSTLRRTRFLKCCTPFCCRTEKLAQSMLSVAVFLCAVRTWKTGSTFTSFAWLRCLMRDNIFWGTCVRHRCRGAGSTRESDSGLTGTHAN